MTISQRLRTCAKHTGLDAVIELLTEAADEIDRLSAGQQAEAQQPSSKEHLFELWWEAHMPNATQEQAWTAFTAAVASNDVGIAAQHPAKGEPVAGEWFCGNCRVPVPSPASHPAPSVPEFSRIAKRKLADLQEQGFTITGYAIQCGTRRGFITNGGFVGWWRSDETTSVPADAVRDAERYRWLRKSLAAGQGSITVVMDDRLNGRFQKPLIMGELDASIDAAMLAAK